VRSFAPSEPRATLLSDAAAHTASLRNETSASRGAHETGIDDAKRGSSLVNTVRPRPDSTQLSDVATRVLTGIAGAGSTVRPDQMAAASALAVEGRRALVVQATGWGKSAVYWIAARALRESGAGLTLVVSPLLALMRNQVEAAERAGLRAASINSSNVDEWDDIQRALAADEIDVLLTSPERLANPRFESDVLPWLIPRLGLLVIDEAHCISSWGHDFRPDYRRITSLVLHRPDLPVLATTATANSRVTDDVAEQLGTDTLVLRGTLARDSLHLSVLPRMDLVNAYAWVDQFLPQLPGSGIVYAATVRTSDELAAYLQSRGHNVAAYHGQLTPEEREDLEDQLKRNALKSVVATSALGMGYDKPDLGFVVHVGSPGSPVDYYQQVGRAGRALDTAQVVLIPTPTDEDIWRYFASASIPIETEAHAVLHHLAETGQPSSSQLLAAATGIRDGRLDLLLKVLAVEGAVRKTTAGWESTGAPWEFDRERYKSLAQARNDEAALMRAYARSTRCLDGVLRQALDDPSIADCGRCSVCVGGLPLDLGPAPSREYSESALAFMRSVDNVLKPRALWAPNMPWKGKISETLRCDEGRALAYGNDPVWPEAIEFTTIGDNPAPDWILTAVVAVLTRWKSEWSARPTVVVPAPSSRQPKLIRSIAEGIASVGKLPVREALAITDGANAQDQSAKARAALQASRLSILPRVDLTGEVVLLVDDTWKTGWTATVAGALLREHGAQAVLPLVVHQQP